jgi:predicted metal-dependent hydrolase
VAVKVNIRIAMAKNESVVQMDGFNVLVSRKRVKNMNLRIYRDGSVKISAPLRCSLSSIQQFLYEKQVWLVAQRERLFTKPIRPMHQYQTGELHFFMGQSYPLIFHEGIQRQKVLFQANQISCYVKENTPREARQLLLDKWYRSQMKALLPVLIQKWEPILGVQVSQWGIKIMKTRWGSCNTRQKRIWLNLNLIQKPLECLEYVLVHEMVHLLEASHNKRFHALMSQFMPEWKMVKSQLEARFDY